MSLSVDQANAADAALEAWAAPYMVNDPTYKDFLEAHKAELIDAIGVAAPADRPAAFDAWLEAQIKSVNVFVRGFYRSAGMKHKDEIVAAIGGAIDANT